MTIALGFICIVQFVFYESLEKRFNEVKDGYLNLVTKKRLIENRNFLRNDEKKLFTILNRIIRDKNIVPQVHLSDLAEVKIGYRDHDNLYYELNRFIFDFVIFDKDFKPEIVVELNGKSHFFLKNRINRDAIVKNLTENLDIKLIEITTDEIFDEDKIKAKFFKS